MSEFIEEGKELGKSIIIGYYIQELLSGSVKIPGGEYIKETSVEMEIPDMPEMPKGEEVLEIPKNIELEPETPGTEVKEIKPEEIEQEMKEIEAEGGGITETEILEGAERVLEGERSEGAEEVVTEAEKLADIGVKIVNSATIEGETRIRAFKPGEAVNHFNKHGKEIKYALGTDSYSLIEYIQDANYVINNGEFVPEINGYVKLIGGTGKAKFAFVGIDRTTNNITTFHIKTASELAKKAPSLGVLK